MTSTNPLRGLEMELQASPELLVQVAGATLAPDDIPQLREQWMRNIEDLTRPLPLELPPLREINHQIQLINSKQPLHNQVARCPDHLRPEFIEKIDRYTQAFGLRQMCLMLPLYFVWKRKMANYEL